jgi:hypothetical protein
VPVDDEIDHLAHELNKLDLDDPRFEEKLLAIRGALHAWWDIQDGVDTR